MRNDTFHSLGGRFRKGISVLFTVVLLVMFSQPAAATAVASAASETAGDGPFVSMQGGPQPDGPQLPDGDSILPLAGDNNLTSVIVAGFEAQPTAEGINLTWQTATEMNLIGFQLWRAVRGEFSFTQLTEKMKNVSNPGSLFGNEYSFLDRNVDAHTLYDYRLQLIHLDGSGSMVSAIYLPPTPVILRIFLPLTIH